MIKRSAKCPVCGGKGVKPGPPRLRSSELTEHPCEEECNDGTVEWDGDMECSSCGIAEHDSALEAHGIRQTRGLAFLCDLCGAPASPMRSLVHRPSRATSHDVMRTVVFCTHAILKAIRGLDR